MPIDGFRAGSTRTPTFGGSRSYGNQRGGQQPTASIFNTPGYGYNNRRFGNSGFGFGGSRGIMGFFSNMLPHFGFRINRPLHGFQDHDAPGTLYGAPRKFW